jgi:acyl-coenzyme A thioesterase PaaI-like protein
VLLCEATAVHGGRHTQVWDAEVSGGSGSRLALFRCTQMILWPKGLQN